MPRSVEDVETFLYRLDRNFERDGDTFLVSSGAGGPPIAVLLNDPVLLIRADIGKVPPEPERQVALLRQLLEYNAEDLVHSSYGLEGDEMVLTGGLQLENLDLNEFAATLADIDLALARHVPRLRELATK